MNLLNDILNHADQLASAAEKSLASLPARALATIKADPATAGCLVVAGALLGLVLRAVL